MAIPGLVIEGRALVGDDIRHVCIGIDDGKITAVGNSLEGERKMNLGSHLIMPGGVDIHTHMRDPGFLGKEDFYSGTLAAAFGGTTTILDMPNTDPPVKTHLDLKEKEITVREKANVDWGLISMLDRQVMVEDMVGECAGFKVFMSDTTNAPPIGYDGLKEILANERLGGCVIAFHAEDPLMFDPFRGKDLAGHDLWRPAESETSAVKRLAMMRSPGIHHISHITNRETLAAAREAGFSTEVSPHHLLLNTDHDIQELAKVLPPVRPEETRRRLFEAFARGEAGIVASDHAPHTLAEKGAGFENAPPGLPGVETRMPVMMRLAADGKIPLGLVQETCCRNPAMLYGLPKGRIEVGFDADLAVYDMRTKTTIHEDRLHSKCGWSPFNGFDAIFPEAVLLRGEVVISDGELKLERSGRRVEQRF